MHTEEHYNMCNDYLTTNTVLCADPHFQIIAIYSSPILKRQPYIDRPLYLYHYIDYFFVRPCGGHNYFGTSGCGLEHNGVSSQGGHSRARQLICIL